MTIGNDILPGIITDIESLTSVSLSGISALNVALVGEGDTAEGTAETNTPYTITRQNAAKTLFGRESPLTDNIVDAISEGAMPVYAVQTAESGVTGEVVDSTSGTLVEAPISSDPESITFTLDGTDATTTVVYTDPSTETPEVDEAIVNPVTGEYELESAPTDGTVDYGTLDYEGALDALQTEEAEVLDAIGTIDENVDVSSYLETTVNSMEGYGDLAVGVVGAGPYIDTSAYTSSYDNSRMAVGYPFREANGDSIMGSIIGLIGRLGIGGSIMNKRLSSSSRLIERLSESQQVDLVGEKVIPVASETAGSLIVDDLTAVSDDNQAESQMTTTFNRFVIDRVTEEVNETEQPFIGNLNKQSTRGSLQALIDAKLRFLVESDAIVDYQVEVQERDAMSAFVDVSVETVKPLRNIYNTIAAGQIDG